MRMSCQVIVKILLTTAYRNDTNITALQDAHAWEVVLGFASGTVPNLPTAEAQLEALLGERYKAVEWKEAYDAVFKAEDDTAAAVTAVETLQKAALAQKGERTASIEGAATLSPALLPDPS